MKKPLSLLLALAITLSSCTAFKTRVRAVDDRDLTVQDFEGLELNDKLRLKTKSGSVKNGKLERIDGSTLVIRKVNKENFQVDVRDIKKIKYEVDVVSTTLKILVLFPLTVAVIWLADPGVDLSGAGGFNF